MAAQTKKTGSVKHDLINSANRKIVILTGIAGFVLVFTLVAANALIKQVFYQDKVIDARKNALQIAQTNITNVEQLVAQYSAFTSTPQNVIGGSSSGVGDGNGDNAQIIINALPSRYDFPALTASLEYLVQRNGLALDGITATDDEIAQQTNGASSAPEPVEIPFTLSVSGSLPQIQALVKDFQLSIRPFQIHSLTLTASEGSEMSAQITGKTFFQPAKNLNIREEVVQ